MEKPDNKVQKATAGAAVATIIVFILALMGVPVPPGVEGAIATLVAGIAGYFATRNRNDDTQIVP